MRKEQGVAGDQFAAGLLDAAERRVLVAIAGPAPALFLDATTYIYSAACVLWAFHGVRAQGERGHLPEANGYLLSLKAGLSFLSTHRVVRLIALQSALRNMFLTPLTGLILVVLVKET